MLQDSHGRTFKTLRLSITNQCNFRCVYCLPEGYQKPRNDPPFLTPDEIRRLVSTFAELGLSKVRITGGEPTLRKDFLSIVETLAKIPLVEKRMLSTNGYRLHQEAVFYRKVGIHGLNISVDSLQPERFKALTGHDKLPFILAGIEKALQLGFHPIKINTVLMKDINDSEFPDFLSFVRSKPVCVRFIELMPTSTNSATFYKHHFRLENLKEALRNSGWVEIKRGADQGPAQEFMHSDYQGTIGLITPYSKQFCEICNRLRVTSYGELKLCLFGSQSYSLRSLLIHDDQKPILKETIQHLLLQKRSAHELQSGNYGNVIHFAAMGG